MKKLIGTVAVAAMLAGAAFAEGITFGSWGRGLWVPVANGNTTNKVDDDTIVNWIGQSWGNWGKDDGPRTALSVHGDSANVGFALDIFGNGMGFGMGDNAFIYVKPIEQVKLTVGMAVDVNVLRSDACFGLWNWDRIGTVGAVDEEGWIFPDLLDREVSLIVTPIEGLTIGAAYNPETEDSGAKPKAADQLGRTGSIAVAYTIADIGTIKAGVQGKGRDKWDNNFANHKTPNVNKDKDGEVKDLVEIDAAFELTAIENMYFAVGAFIPVGGTYVDGYNKGIDVHAYGRMGFDALTLHVLAGLRLNAGDSKAGDAKADGAFGFRFGAGVDYALDNGIGLMADVSYANGIWMAGTSADKADTVTFGAGVSKGFSNGCIGVAFEGSTNGYGRAEYKEADAFAWEIPVKVEYWF